MIKEDPLITWFKNIKKEDIATAGGKGANLGEMYQEGFPIPNGFVVTAQAFDIFILETNIKQKIREVLDSIDINQTKELEEKARQIQRIILEVNMSDELKKEILESYKKLSTEDDIDSKIMKPISELCFTAVRSSATTEDLKNASFAGQQETYIDIKGNDNLLEAIKKVWASLFTARAIFYRIKKGFEPIKSSIAVIVQKMINFDKAGVMFSVNPINYNKEEVVIEAVFGAGEGIVSGQIEPDNYIMQKYSKRLLNKRIGRKKLAVTRNSAGKTVIKQLHEGMINQQVLQKHELDLLTEYALKIEQHYKHPQDIEFGWEGSNLFITQSRAITTLNQKEAKKTEISGKEILSGLAASKGIASGIVKIIREMDDLSKISKGDILVTKMTNPDMVVAMQKAAAIITNEGGLTAHAAIISRELGIPAIVGTSIATEILKDGIQITVDGFTGKIYSGEQKVEIQKEEPKIETPKEKILHPEVSRKTSLKVNVDFPNIAEKAAATGADGVGLVRLEFIIAEKGVHPAGYLKENKLDEYTNALFEGLQKIAQAFKGKPVWVRTSDIRTDEYKNLKGAEEEPKESNPMLGWHGIRRSLDQEKILEAEFKAIKKLHDSGFKNVGVMIPFVINVEELKKAKEIMKRIGLDPITKIEFGVMIETPASCLIIDELGKEGLSFISFGTNDLTQLTLGIDRNNERLAPLYRETHPAIQRLIRRTIKTCKYYHIKTSICGQAGSDPEMVKFLLDAGIDSISVNLDSFEDIFKIVT
ncbi:MAG: phosphoenolpyruvate synthase [archaeon]